MNVEFALGPGVGTQIEVGAIGDTFEFLEAVRELIHHIEGGLRVVGQLLLRHVVQLQAVALDSLRFPPVEPLFHPALMPFFVGTRLHEELEFHLLEFADPEDEIARGDLIAESLADLGDAERQPRGRGVHHIAEIGEDRLCCFGAQVGEAGAIGHGPEIRLEHQVERSFIGQIVRTAVRAHLFLQVIGAMSCIAFAAIHQRVAEGVFVTRVAQCQWIGEDGRVESLDIVPLIDHRAPPGGLQIVLQLDAQRAVVVYALQTAVDVARLKYEAAALAQRHQFIHGFCWHLGSPLSGLRGRELYRKFMPKVHIGSWHGSGQL